MIQRRRKVFKRKIRKGMCLFCKNKTIPDYKNEQDLLKYVSERGKIQPRTRSGVCQKHQKILSKSIKRARFLAVLPFVVRPV